MTRHEAHDGAQRARAERRGSRGRGGRPRPQKGARGSWRCPRCGSGGDPRACNCMRQLRRLLDETRTRIEQGRSLGALEPLAGASQLLDLLTKDAIKAAGGNTGG